MLSGPRGYLVRMVRAKGKPHPGIDPRARTARWSKQGGEWCLLVSPVWGLVSGDEVSVARKGDSRRRLMMLGEYVGNTGVSKNPRLDCKDCFKHANNRS